MITEAYLVNVSRFANGDGSNISWQLFWHAARHHRRKCRWRQIWHGAASMISFICVSRHADDDAADDEQR